MTGPQRLAVLLDVSLRREFDALCSARRTNASRVTRALIEQFILNGGQNVGDYLARRSGIVDPRLRGRTGRLTILIEAQAKQRFEFACAAVDLTPSQVLRRLIREWVIEQAALGGTSLG